MALNIPRYLEHFGPQVSAQVQANPELTKFAKKPQELLKLWRDFQKDFFADCPKTKSNKELISFSKTLIEDFNTKNPGSQIEYKADASAAEFAKLINSHITQEDQEEFWQALDKGSQDAVINEQKYKYGTLDFTNLEIPRIVTAMTRVKYTEAIKKCPIFEKNNFKLLGIGFSGAAFSVEDSRNHARVPHYVLKVPVTITGPERENLFAPLDLEYPELEKLTKFSEKFSQEIGEPDHFSQTLASFDVGQKKFYLGRQAEEHDTVLATIFQPGENLYQSASDDNEKKLLHLAQPDKADKALNPYVVNGVSDHELTNLIRYYQGLAKEGINFYDLFPHNMHYYAKDGSLRLIDASSTPNELHQKITDARQAFPIDTCIYDLLTFLSLQEQKHPFTKAVRKNTRLTLRQFAIKDGQYLSADKMEESYIQNLFIRLDKIIRCLGKAVDKKAFSKEELVQALGRLNNFDRHAQSYGKHYETMQKDFERLTDRGRKFIDFIYQKITNPDFRLEHHRNECIKAPDPRYTKN